MPDAPPNTLWLTQDFSVRNAYQPLPARDGLSGQLPAGWHDASAWCPVRVRYDHRTDASAPAGFLHAEADGEGKLQFMHPLPHRLERVSAWRLTLRTRSAHNIGLLLGVRRLDRPEESDRFLASALFNVALDWADHTFTLRSAPSDLALGFYVNFGVHGKVTALDLAHLTLTAIDPATYTPPTVLPKPREEAAVRDHQRWSAEAAERQPAVIFLGDSITQGFARGEGRAVWQRDIAPLNAVGFGIGGNQVQHVLWQVQTMGLGAAFTPRVVVLMIGINNYFHVDSDLDIAEGIAHLIAEIRVRTPSSKLLLLGILPQGRVAGTLRREEIAELNRHIAALADGRTAHFLDMGRAFLDPAGRLPESLSPDATHLTAAGYEIWSREMLPTLHALLR